ncbi:ion channel [Aquimarina algicola]|uniref:Two pore domain potassium channel family protein n=1 Tax=Aquimarina algicola TaxID=2589995 RepID=A0A504JGJ5_9FLAO|nr:ion channel [Aquimarina algicola]TPN86783.1 two pore domain potassium channel family protein [Aquimarina algicola]
MIEKLYQYRFEIFFSSQISILFGSLLFYSPFFEGVVTSLLLLVNLISGILLISNKKPLMWFFIILLASAGLVFSANLIDQKHIKPLYFLDIAIHFLFYIVVTIEIIKQIWETKKVNRSTILGLMSGYISLGLIGFFICISIEISSPGSFQGINTALENPELLTEELLYYSYVTLLTIGYGEIVPVTPLSQKAAILISLLGQFYHVILTAIIVGKYLNSKNESESK